MPSIFGRYLSGVSAICFLVAPSLASAQPYMNFNSVEPETAPHAAEFVSDNIANPMMSGGDASLPKDSSEKSSTNKGDDEIFDGGGNFRPAPPAPPRSVGGQGSQIFRKETPYGDGASMTETANRDVSQRVENPASYVWHRKGENSSAGGAQSNTNDVSLPDGSGAADGTSSSVSFNGGSGQGGQGNQNDPSEQMDAGQNNAEMDAGQQGSVQQGQNAKKKQTSTQGGEEGAIDPNDKLYIIPSHKGENSDAAITDILNNTNAPLTAIERAKRAADENRRAMAHPPVLPKHVSRSLHLKLMNGEERPVIHLMKGNVTTIVFHDLTGAKWEYRAQSFDGESFAQVNGNGGSQNGKGGGSSTSTNIFCIQPIKSYSMGTNAEIFLNGLDIPVVFIMEAGYSGEVDDLVDVTIAKRGPNAKVGYSELGITPDHDNFLQPFVDGVPPNGARKLPTTNDGVEAWLYSKKLVIRTTYPLESGYLARSDQVGGAVAYKINPHLNFVTISIGGVITSVEIQR